MVVHVEPQNEDGSPTYAFGRRTKQIAPVFSELSHLSSPEDKTFATYISTGETAPVRSYRDRPRSSGAPAANLSEMLDGVEEGEGGQCLKPECRDVVKQIIGAQSRLSEERVILEDELNDLTFEANEEEAVVQLMEKSLQSLHSQNNDLETQLEGLQEAFGALKERKFKQDAAKTEMANKLMVMEAEKQKLARRQKEIAKTLSDLLWKGKGAEEDSSQYTMDMGNMRIKKLTSKEVAADEMSVETSYYGLARDNVLDFTDRVSTVKSRRAEGTLLRNGALLEDRGLRTGDGFDSKSLVTQSTRGGSFTVKGGKESIRPESDLRTVQTTKTRRSKRMTSTTSFIGKLAYQPNPHPSYRRPLTPSRSHICNSVDGSPSQEPFYEGVKVVKPFPFMRKGTGEPLQCTLPHMLPAGHIGRYGGSYSPTNRSMKDVDMNSVLTEATPFYSDRDSFPLNDVESPAAWRKLDPVFYDEKSRKNFARRGKAGVVTIRSVTKEDIQKGKQFTSVLTSKQPDVFTHEQSMTGHEETELEAMESDDWHRSSTFEALGDINKVSLSLENMADLEFYQPPKSPLSIASGQSRGGSRRSQRSRGSQRSKGSKSM